MKEEKQTVSQRNKSGTDSQKNLQPGGMETFSTGRYGAGEKGCSVSDLDKKRKLSEVHRRRNPQGVVRDFLRGMQLLPVDDAG